MAALATAAVCLALLVLAPGALGAEYEIEAAKDAVEFRPHELTIAPGDGVRFFMQSGGAIPHNVHFEDTGVSCPPLANTSGWICPRTYAAAGHYQFTCDAHPGMDGTVHVVAQSEPDPDPPTTPTPTTPVPDVVSPGVALSGSRAQRVLRNRAVVVRVETTEAATVIARGSVRVPRRARRVRFQAAKATTVEGRAVRLRLRLTRSGLRAVRRGFTYRRRLAALVRVSATDASGNRSVESRRIVLKR